MEEEVKYPIKVIYAEDNPLDIDITRKIFEPLKNKFDLTFVITGKELLEILKEKSFDLILLDNHLPDVEGVDLIPKLINLKVNSPIIIITGLGDEELVLKAMKFGATDYITKSGDYLEKLPEYLERTYLVSKKLKQTKIHVRVEDINVLYIEHDLNDIELTKNYILKETPHIKLTTVTKSIDALNLLNERNFDLILLDLRMPDIDGIELVRLIKNKNIGIPVVIVTGKGDEQSAIEALKLGVYDYVNKDIDYIEKLPRIIETSYLKFKYDKSLLNHEKKYLDLNITLEQQFQERTLSLIKEIERRKDSEKKFYDLYVMFETFLNSIGDLVVVKDKDLRIIFVNNAFQSFFEIGLEELTEGLVTNGIQHFNKYDAVLDREVRESLSERTKLLKLIDKKGNEKYFEVKKTPILDENKSFNGIISIYRDLTERIILANELKISEERYRSFVENSSELISRFELERPIDISLPVEEQIKQIYDFAKLSECNLAFVKNFGFSSMEEMRGYPLGRLLPYLSETNRELIKEFISNGYTIKNFESQELKSDGSVIYFLNSFVGIVENNKLTRIWIVKRDITELKKLNLELEERVRERTRKLELLNSELEDFNSAVSHDLRAPIRAIVGFSEILLKEHGKKLDEDVRDLINDVISNGKKLQTMLEDLLRLSKLSVSELKLEQFSLKDLALEIINDFNKRNEVGHAKIFVGDLPEILADKSLITIAFTNLISNAIKFSMKNEEPKIEIGTLADDKSHIIFVKDNGVGFDIKYKSKLFKPFQRLHSGTEFPGTGIGLAIVKKIIDRHNGKIWVESELNKGTIFYISFVRNK